MANSGWTNDQLETLIVGDIPGQHFIINNPATGDILDVYDTLNRLVFKIDSTGTLVAYDQPAQDFVQLNGAGIVFESGTAPLASPASVISFGSGAYAALQLDSGNAPAGFGDAIITLGDSTFPGANGRSDIKVYQRGTPGTPGIDGSLVQTDAFGQGNNLVHAASYSGTTDAGGHLVFNHNALFTPHVVSITGTTSGGTFANLTYGVNAKTATQLDVNFTIANTGAPWANNLITFDAVLFG